MYETPGRAIHELARNLHFAVGFYSYEADGFLDNLAVFESIDSCGITIPAARSTWVCATEDGIEWGLIRHTIVFEIDRHSILQFLWGSLTHDIDIRPRLTCDVYLFDLKLGILAHPYDDRGMDIIGNNLGILRSAYTKLDRYLLEYDRATV